jgi:hypothetical protein
VNYKSDFPKFVVQQDPLPGEKWKWEEKYISKLTVLDFHQWKFRI